MSPRYWRLYWMSEKGTPYLRDYPWRFERKGLRVPRRDPRRPQKPHGISGYDHMLQQYLEEGARLAEERQHQNQCRLHATLGFCSRCLEDK